MKLLRLTIIMLGLFAVAQGAHAQGISAVIQFCGQENTLGCGCDQGTRVPFEDGSNQWCVFWDRTANGIDASDQLVEIGTDIAQANYSCLAFNGTAYCGIAGNFVADPAFYIENPPIGTDQPVYFIKVSGSNCCWVSDTFRLAVGFSDLVLTSDNFDCTGSPCPIGAVPTPVTNVVVSDDQYCSAVDVSWNHSGVDVSGFKIYVYDETAEDWVFIAQLADTLRETQLTVCADGEVQVGVQTVNGSQSATLVPGVGRTFLRNFSPANSHDIVGADITMYLVSPLEGDVCSAKLYFDFYSGGNFVSRLCEFTNPDDGAILEVTCALPSQVPNPNCYIVLYDSSRAESFVEGCGSTDTIFFALAGDDQPVLPREFALQQNFPNPFNPNTTIEFTVPNEGDAELAIFNLAGQKVATLVSGNVSAGQHRVEWNGAVASTGVYFYRLQMGHQVLTRKMLLLK